MGWWNTGCRNIRNFSGSIFRVTDRENPGRMLTINPGESQDFNGLFFPWCKDSAEIVAKAFFFETINVFRGMFVSTTGQFFMFQFWPKNNQIFFAPFNNGVPVFPGTAAGQPPLPNIDVIINPNMPFTPSALPPS